MNEEQEKDALRMCNVEKGQKYATQASPTNLKKQNSKMQEQARHVMRIPCSPKNEISSGQQLGHDEQTQKKDGMEVE